ncbi:MAG: ATP-dependent zinc metalloprotease FtsH [Chloroflexi bacterium]|nr:ATP-dependent zinc metalloprotease FtsH [Chloroflexota bacterium]
MDQRVARNFLVYILILVACVAIFWAVLRNPSSGEDVAITQIVTLAKDKQITEIVVEGNTVTAKKTDGTKVKARKESGVGIIEILDQAEVPISGENAIPVKVKGNSSLGNVFGLLLNFLPIIIIGAFLLLMMRQAQGTNNQAMSFGRSRAKMFVGNRTTVTFSDVAGVEEAKQELQEVVEFLMYPERFASLGAKIPRGVLLVGPPGTGKTLLAKAVAGEAGVPFFSISGSEFVEMFVGVGASRVRDLFDQARRNSPCIIFIDEIDAVGRHRGAGLGGGHDEREQTLNQILVEMDGFDATTNVIIIAATNRPDILDPALLRPGRFDRRVVLDAPDVNGRKSILTVHTKGKPVEPAVDLEIIAKQTHGFSGADLANLVNEAALLAARRQKKAISMAELEEAIDRVWAGPERKSRVVSAKEKEITAYHEAGHALVSHLLKAGDIVHKVTIVPRGMAGGYTRFLPEEELHYYNRTYLKDRMAVSLGGRAAEEVIFGDFTNGAADDLQRTTYIARKMITEWGMSQQLGPRTLGQKQELVFLGREISEQRDYGDKIADQIDEEIKSLVDEAYQRAVGTLRFHKAKLVQIARTLITKETLEGKDLLDLLNSPAPALEEGDTGRMPAPAPSPA